MEIPGYEPFYLETLDDLRAEIARLGLDIPVEEDLNESHRPYSWLTSHVNRCPRFGGLAQLQSPCRSREKKPA